MLDHLLFTSALLATLGAGLIAGVFFAFSTFVMRALRRLPPREGIVAMQSINIAVINPLFLGVFLGTALLCIVCAMGAAMGWGAGAGWMLAGSGLYFGGTFLVTMLFNVPLNNGLAILTPGDASAGDHWTRYVRRWTAWNHVRTVAAILATAAFVLALRG